METLKYEDQETENPIEKKFPIRRVCSGCKKELPGSPGFSDIEGEISHGLCDDCVRKWYPELADKVLGKEIKQKEDKEQTA